MASIYIGVKKQLPNYTELEKYLTVDTFSDFFDSTQGTYKWEVKSMGQVLNNVLIEPTGSYSINNLTESNNYFEVVPKIDFKGLNIFLSYITETNYDKVYFSYNGTIKINGVSGTSSENVTVNLTDVKAGDKLKFWYVKDGSQSATNEKVQFQLVTIETPKIKVEDGTYHTEELSEKVDKLYFSLGNIAKTVLRGYIGVNNLSKMCFSPKTLGDLSIGDTLEIPVVLDWQSRFGQSIVFKIADKNHAGYPNNCTTLITDKIIQLMASDAKEPYNHDDEHDSSRKNYGNNRHIYSNLLQWLNSNATAGAWYSAKHSADQAPTNNTHVTYNPYTSWAGFLAMLDPKFIAELLTTMLTVVKSSFDGGGSETFTAKMFLASTTEVGLANENSIAEGTLLALFSNNASRVAYPTAECVSNSEYKTSSFNTSKGWYWWLRTPIASGSWYPCNVHTVASNGSLGESNAYSGNDGVRPLCNLSNNVLISKEPNANGHYTLL